MISFIGDSFWNSCFSKSGRNETIAMFFMMLFRWTEPIVLAEICFSTLFILPFVFILRHSDSTSKTVSLYNTLRLNVLIIFHKFIYIYAFFVPLAFFIGQTAPCIKNRHYQVHKNEDQFAMPYPKLAIQCLVLFHIATVTSIQFKPLFVVFGVIIIILSSLFIITGYTSFAQTLFTLTSSYIIHFISCLTRFWYYLIGDILGLIIFIAILVQNVHKFREVSWDEDDKWTLLLGRLITGLFIDLIDMILIGHFIITRRNYAKVGSIRDYQKKADGAKFYSVLSSQDGYSFRRHLRSDMFFSVLTAAIYVTGFIVRGCVAGCVKSSPVGLI